MGGSESCATPGASARPGNRDDRYLRGALRGWQCFSLRSLRTALRLRAGKKGLARRRAAKRHADQQRFASEMWRRDGALAHRDYASYDEYVEHQSSKLAGIIDRLREKDAEEFEEFRERFASCDALVDAGSILCLGARLGTEVRALHSLGHFAVGIDLAPGPDNPRVLHGDFHALVFPNGSVDAVYSNALDHAFDLDRMLSEVRRILRPGGCFVAEIFDGFDEGSFPGNFEALWWASAQTLTAKIAKVGGFEIEQDRAHGSGRRVRRLVAFRKPR